MKGNVQDNYDLKIVCPNCGCERWELIDEENDLLECVHCSCKFYHPNKEQGE